MTVHPTLYKKTTTGATQIWYQESDGSRYRTTSGQKDGALVTSEWTQCTGKNIGRANETTPEDQCAAEIQSNYTKKLAQGGYHDDIKDINKAKYFSPMLAKSYDDYPLTGIAFERGIVYWQPKLDGIRSIVDESGAWSRKGKEFFTVPHIREALRELTDGDDRFDGELYNHLLKQDFNKITSLVKKTKPTLADLVESAKMIQYHIYDLPSVIAPFSERTEMLEERLKRIGHPSLVYVRTVKVKDHAQLMALTDEAVQDNYEGGITRIDGHEYEQKRTKNLLKMKLFVDEEYTVTDIEEGTGNWAGKARIIHCVIDDKPFKADMMGTMEYCAEVLKNKAKYIGGDATVKRSKDLTPAGIPRWGKVKALHGGKREL